MINFFKFFKKNKFEFSDRSKEFLSTVDTDLQKLVNLALANCEIQFQVYFGVRTIEQQIAMVKNGKSKTYNSRHLHGYAVDIYAEIEKGKADWSVEHYKTINNAFQIASKKLNIPYSWGGDWTSFKDFNHWELPKAKYQDKPEILKELKSRKLI